MARKTGQIIRRGLQLWMVRIYVGRDPETRKRNYIGKSITGGLRAAQAHLTHMLAERDLGRNIRSSKQTLAEYLDHWLDICARPRLRAKSFHDYTAPQTRLVGAGKSCMVFIRAVVLRLIGGVCSQQSVTNFMSTWLTSENCMFSVVRKPTESTV
jgi:hypothetical protein